MAPWVLRHIDDDAGAFLKGKGGPIAGVFWGRDPDGDGRLDSS
jgi:hypothetical protein